MTAPAPTLHHQTDRFGGGRAPTFQERIRDAVRQLRRSAKISRADDQVLKDFSRGRNLIQLERLARVARSCTDAADATAIAEAFRGFVLAGHFSHNVTTLEAMRREAACDGAEDAAVQEFLANPGDSTRLAAIEALRRVVETSQALIDALHRGQTP